MDLISIIVPVYKVEKYLDRCVESIVNQTYRNLEIILVDDGSPDNCPAMCEAWAQRDSRIRVIHKENGGLSDARNAGMAVVTGEYFGFVDSDDWIERDMYRTLLEKMKSSSSDIGSCGAIRVWEDSKTSKPMHNFTGEHVLDKLEAMTALLRSTYLIQTVWNKLYRTELIKDLLFEKGKIHEDEFWSWQAIARANRVVAIAENLYNYAQRPGSIMGDGYTGEPLIVVEARERRQQYIAEKMPKLNDISNEEIIGMCHFQCTQVLKNEKGQMRKEYLHRLRNTVSNCSISCEYYKTKNLYRRIRLWSLQHFFLEMCWLDFITGRI